MQRGGNFWLAIPPGLERFEDDGLRAKVSRRHVSKPGQRLRRGMCLRMGGSSEDTDINTDDPQSLR
jgi:hypothetical protein